MVARAEKLTRRQTLIYRFEHNTLGNDSSRGGEHFDWIENLSIIASKLVVN